MESIKTLNKHNYEEGSNKLISKNAKKAEPTSSALAYKNTPATSSQGLRRRTNTLTTGERPQLMQ